MTRFDAGPIEVEKQWFPLEDVIGSALGRLRKELTGRVVNKDLAPNLPLVPLDGVLIEQVLVNLLENALKYSEHGSPLDIYTRAESGQVVLGVGDRGPGLTEGEEERVFEKLFRGSASSVSGQRGAGLGLAIAHAIVNAHGGRIWAENRAGGGATFWFVLPIEGSAPDLSQDRRGRTADVNDQTPPGRASIGPEPVQNGLAVVTRVLIIEDDRPIRRFLEAALTNAGYEVAEAETGRMGLTRYWPVCLILSSLTSGFPTWTVWRSSPGCANGRRSPSSFSPHEEAKDDKVEALNAGADDYLTKPFGVPELLARIRVALRHAAALKAGGQEEASRFQAGDLVVDLASRRVFVGGVEVHLTPLEYRLLTTLVRNAGKVLTHRYLLREVWGPGYQQQTHYPRMFVASLRRKLEDDPADPRYILTEQGVGYRLVED